MKKKRKKYIILLISLFVVALFAYHILWGFERADFSDSDGISILWMEDSVISSQKNFSIVIMDDTQLFTDITNTITACTYRALFNQQDSNYSHSIGTTSYKLNFYEQSSDEPRLSYTIYSDHVLIINGKFMKCGLLSPYTARDIYDLIDNLIMSYQSSSMMS